MAERRKRDWIPTLALVATIVIGIGGPFVAIVFQEAERLSVVETEIIAIDSNIKDIKAYISQHGPIVYSYGPEGILK